MSDGSLRVSVKHRFDARFSLEVAFDVPPGITVLRGPSGSGKTTTLHAIAGLFHPDFADIRLGETTWQGLPPERRRVSLAFQSLALFPHLTVRQNIRYGPTTSDAMATEWLERMRIAHLADRKPAALSGGEAQRVSLARAFARAPSVVLLDETFSSLDDAMRVELLNEVTLHLARLAVPTLLVTHDARDLEHLRGRVISLESGRISYGT